MLRGRRNQYPYNALLISKTKIYEVSGWVRNIQSRIKNCKRRIDLQGKWFDLVQSSLLQSNLSILNTTQELFIEQRDKIRRKNLWRYFMLSVASKKRIEQVEYFASQLKLYVLRKKRERWIQLTNNYNRKIQKENLKNSFYNFKVYFGKWIDYSQKVNRKNYQALFFEAQKALAEQRTNKKKHLTSHRKEWISMIQRLKRQNLYNLFHAFQNGENLFHDEFSSIETQTSVNRHSKTYKNFKKLVRNYLMQNFYSHLDEHYKKYLEKQNQKKLRRQREARRNWRYLVHHYRKLSRIEEFQASFDDLQFHLSKWKKFYRYLYLQNLSILCENGLAMLDARYLRISQKMKRMIMRTLLNHKSKIVFTHLQEYREKQLQKAANFGTQFLSKSMNGLDAIVRDNYIFKPDHYQKTKPRRFWSDSADFAFSFTHECLYKSINLAIPYLTDRSSPLAEAFAECETVLSRTDQNHRTRFSDKNGLDDNEKKHKNVHIIIGFGYNDKVSLLGNA